MAPTTVVHLPTLLAAKHLSQPTRPAEVQGSRSSVAALRPENKIQSPTRRSRVACKQKRMRALVVLATAEPQTRTTRAPHSNTVNKVVRSSTDSSKNNTVAVPRLTSNSSRAIPLPSPRDSWASCLVGTRIPSSSSIPSRAMDSSKDTRSRAIRSKDTVVDILSRVMDSNRDMVSSSSVRRSLGLEWVVRL